MKITHAAGLVIGAGAVVAGIASPACAATPVPPPTVSSIKAKVDAKAGHITTKLQALRTKVATKPKLANDKTLLQADIAKTLADTATWRKQIDAAVTKAGIRLCDPAHRTVRADLARLHADLAAANGKKKTAK